MNFTNSTFLILKTGHVKTFKKNYEETQSLGPNYSLWYKKKKNYLKLVPIPVLQFFESTAPKCKKKNQRILINFLDECLVESALFVNSSIVYLKISILYVCLRGLVKYSVRDRKNKSIVIIIAKSKQK